MKPARSNRSPWRVVWATGPIGLAVLAAGALALVALGSGRVRTVPDRRSPRPEPDSRTVAHRPASSWRIVHEGVEIKLTIDPINRRGPSADAIREGDDVVFRFKIADTTTGAPLKDVYPAAWVIDREPGQGGPKTCLSKAQVLIGGSLLSPPELDLNVYHILTLNQDATLSVVDPRSGFGGSKLLALVTLEGTGQDWALDRDGSRLFVSMPEVGKVAVVDTSSWKVAENIDVGPLPTRVVLQPDGHYLWLAHDPRGPSGASLTAIDVERRRVAATVRVGQGLHEIAFRADGRYLFATNSDDGTLSVVDTHTLRAVSTVDVGPRPASLAYSPLADRVYVTDAAQGTISLIDAGAHRVVGRVQAEPGQGRIAFTPGGRLGFTVNPATGRLSILDASSGRLIQSTKLREGPDQIAFTNQFAYIRHGRTEHVVTVPLAKVGDEGRPIPTVDFPAGQNPLGLTGRPTPAASIVQAPGENAVLVANPSDKSVYYYKEGMAAPMGNFSNYKREPRAVLVVDRSLRERDTPGIYETTARLRRPGPFDVVFFLGTPRIVECFPIDVASDPVLVRDRERARTAVEPLLDERAAAGEATTLRFRLSDPTSGTPKAGLKDVVIVAFSPGGWQARRLGRDEGDGLYSAEIVLPTPGPYYVSVGCHSLGLRRNQADPVILRAVRGGPPEQPDAAVGGERPAGAGDGDPGS